MSLFADLITLLGRNYILVVVGCIEVVAAVVLLGYIPRRRRRVKKQKADFSVSERLLLQELSEQKNEVCIALRRSDLMPTEVIGALEPLLGVTPSRLSEDVKSMLGCAKNHDDEAAFWKKYEAFVEDERLSIESGMNGHLSKPIDYDALFGIIGQMIQKEVKDI